MPDPSELSRQRPERPDQSTPAPEGLRRRVLARVRAEPDPPGSAVMRAARRLPSGPLRIVAGLLAGALLTFAVTLALTSTGGGPGTVGAASVARGLGAARASLHRVSGHAELLLAGMPPAPTGQVYEVWLSGPRSDPRPTNALFNVTSSGMAAVEVPGSLRGVSKITVTTEPVGGSRRPTSPVIISVALGGSHAGTR
jgi:hypothetical protein